MSETRQWSGNRLKSAAMQAAAGAGFWRTPLGSEFADQLERYVSGSIARQVRSTLRYPIEAAEITHIILINLTEQKSLINGLKRSSNPWAYLASCAKQWGWDQANHRVLDLDALIDVPASGSSVDEIFVPEHGLTLLDEVIESAVSTIGGYLDEAHLAVLDLPSVVRWFALNPPQHQGHGHADARKTPELRALGFTSAQIGALANVTWGGRPNMHHTSLFYGFLLDPLFSPEASRTHRIALTSLRRTFLREQAVSKGRAS